MIFKTVLNKRTMCEQQLSLNDDNNKRRRHRTHHLMISTMLNSWNSNLCSYSKYGSSYGSFSATGGPAVSLRSLCVFTTGLAFILGLFIGAMIPLYILPRTSDIQSELSLSAASVKQNISRYINNNVRNDSSIKNSVVSLKNATVYRHPEVEPSDTRPIIGYQSVSFVVKSATHRQPETLKSIPPQKKPKNVFRHGNLESDSSVIKGIYWGQRVENAMPKGFDDEETDYWRRYARKTPVVKVDVGCGRMQNRLLTFEDGTQACCRYRQNTDQIQGELFSFYLGRLLGLKNLVPSALGLVRFRDPNWSRVKSQLALALWNEERAVVLTQFVSSLEPAHIPAPLRASSRRLHPPDIFRYSSSTEQLVDLAQWSDLILFDYLTANLDRVVNNLYNLQWNPAMMDAPTHNLAREPSTGLLVFFDNESGLLHGYRLLDKYEQYHGIMLEALCVFRKPTVDIIKQLHRDRNVGALLQKRFETCDPEFRDILPGLPDKSIKILNERINRIYDQIIQCERQYMSSNLS